MPRIHSRPTSKGLYGQEVNLARGEGRDIVAEWTRQAVHDYPCAPGDYTAQGIIKVTRSDNRSLLTGDVVTISGLGEQDVQRWRR